MPAEPTHGLADVPDGLRIFLDANIFVYHFSGPTPLSPAASTLLERVEAGSVAGVTSTLVLVETLHRLMILEAVGTLKIPPRDAVRYLKEHPEQAKTLDRHHAVPAIVAGIGIAIADVQVDDVRRSHDIKRRFGFLTNDAVLVATMERLEITALASNDGDFTRVDGLTVYQPSPSP